MTFSFFNDKLGIKNKKKSVDIDVSKALEIIKSDKQKDYETLIQIRQQPNKSIRQALKQGLSYFCISGTFKERSEEGLKKHSGLIQVDFDGLEDKRDEKGFIISTAATQELREKLINDPYTHALFLGPSGDGLKLIVKIDATEHLGSYIWLEGYYFHTYGLKTDEKCKDVSRACYISYDPNTFYNENSKRVELPSPDLKVDFDSGEVTSVESAKPIIAADQEKQYRIIEAYIKQLEEKKVDITDDYGDWLIVCFCLASLGEIARELFHRVSKLNAKYDPKSCDDKFTNALKTTKFKTPAKFILLCKERGIEVKLKKIPKLIPEGRPDGVDIDENTEWRYINSKTKNDITFTEDDPRKRSVHYYRITEDKNCYFFAEKFDSDDMVVHLRPFSNFIIRPLFLVLSKTDPKRIIEIENIYGVKKTIDIPTKAFTSLSEFNCFIESQGNFLFTDKPPFTQLKVKIYELTMNADEVKTLGWHSDGVYFFANGGFHNGKFHPIDKFGILSIDQPKLFPDENDVFEEESKENKKHYFLPALSDIYRDSAESYENEKKFIYIARPDVKFDDWASQLVSVHKSNGMLGMLFYMAALFSDVIYSKFKFFPHLFLFGLPGSGKSTLAWSLESLFGLAQNPFQLSAGTPVGFFRTFASFKNGLAWFDEYSNDIDPKRIQALKGAYDRSGHVKGMMDNSNKTTTTHINSACLISGQQLPIADVALFKRCILLQFDKTDYSEESKAALAKLQALEQKGLSHITAAMMTFRPHIEENFLKEFDLVNKELAPLLTDISETRLIQNTVIPLSMFKLTCQKLKFPFDWEELKAVTVKMIKDQNHLISHSKETSVFWDIVAYLHTSRMICDPDDFRIQHLNEIRITIDGEQVNRTFESTTALLFLRLARIHPMYLEHHRKQTNKTGMDKNSISHYLTSQKGFVGMVRSTRFGEHVSSAYVFRYDALQRDGYDFQKHMEPEEKDNSSYKIPPHPPEEKAVAQEGLPF